MAAPRLEVHHDRARAHRVRAAGLHRRSSEGVAAVLAATGWLRDLGGVDALVSLAARRAGTTSRDIAAALSAGELASVPGPAGGAILVPPADLELAASAAAGEVTAALLTHVVRRSAPVATASLSHWLGAAEDAVEAAAREAGLVEVDVHEAVPGWLHPDDVDVLRSAEPAAATEVRLLGADDPVVALHGPGEWFDEDHHGLRMPVWGPPPHLLGVTRRLSMRTVLAGDRLVGFWAWDPDAAAVEVRLLDEGRPGVADAVAAEAERTAELLRQVGHARMTPLDGVDTHAARLEVLRSLG